MSLLGFDALGRLALTQLPGGAQAPTVLEDSWHQPWSEPVVKKKIGLRTDHQQTLAFAGKPVVSFGWFEELSKPSVLAKRGFPSREQQFLAYQANPTTVTPFSWFASLSEPVRIKPGLKPSRQQFLAFQPTPSPFIATGWYAPLSSPVRVKIGLAARLQQFLAAPSRLLPTPAVFGILDALETKDVFLLGASVFNPPASAEIGIVDTSFPLAEIGIAAPAVASVSISFQII